MDDRLLRARRCIDAIDRAVLTLLAERAAVTRALVAWKAARGLPLRDPPREASMIAARRAMAVALGVSPWLAEAV